MAVGGSGQSGWLDQISSRPRCHPHDALAGFYKMAGVEFVQNNSNRAGVLRSQVTASQVTTAGMAATAMVRPAGGPVRARRPPVDDHVDKSLRGRNGLEFRFRIASPTPPFPGGNG